MSLWPHAFSTNLFKRFWYQLFLFFPQKHIIHGNLSMHNLFKQKHNRQVQPMVDFNIVVEVLLPCWKPNLPPTSFKCKSLDTPASEIICYAEFCEAIKINSQRSFHPEPPASNNGLSQQVFTAAIWLPMARLKVLFFHHFFFNLKLVIY